MKFPVVAGEDVSFEGVQEGFATETVDDAVHERVTEDKTGGKVHSDVECKSGGK